MAYDNAVYGMKFRKWFGLPPKWGGSFQGAAGTVNKDEGFLLGSGDATYIASWYPSKPIKITKFGVRALVTLSTSPLGTSNAARPLYLGRQGFVVGPTTIGTSILASLHIRGAHAAPGVASNTTMASKELALVNPGSLLCIKGGSILRPAGTALDKSTNAAQVAFFVDYTPQYCDGSDTYWEE